MPDVPVTPEDLVTALAPLLPEALRTGLPDLARLIAARLATPHAPAPPPDAASTRLLAALADQEVPIGNQLLSFTGQAGDVRIRDMVGGNQTNQVTNLTLVYHAASATQYNDLATQITDVRRAIVALEGLAASNPVLAQSLEDQRRRLASLEGRQAQLNGITGAPVPDNLPRRSSTFVGRRAELARCLAALTPDERGWGLIIDGLGGQGKTTLALETAHAAREQALFDAYLFASAKPAEMAPGGQRAASLALPSLDAFVDTFARLLDVRLPPGADETVRRQSLLAALQGRRTLTIWDNLETLSDGERDKIAEFLRRLPGQNKAIITSRRRSGESAMTIRLDRLSREEADQLINAIAANQPSVAGALAAAPHLRGDLYAYSGGSPLALHWTLGQIARFGLTLDHAIQRLRDPKRADDFYRFLFEDALTAMSTPEKHVLTALAGFRTPADAASLREATGLAERAFERALEALTVLSLANDLGDGAYSVHPLTRTYVRHSLETGALSVAAERRVLQYWVAFARVQGGDDQNAYTRFPILEAAWPNLEDAAERLFNLSRENNPLYDPAAAKLLNNMAEDLDRFLQFSGRWEAQVQIATKAYTAMATNNDWKAAFWRAHDVAWVYLNQGRTAPATVWVDKALAAAEQSGVARSKATALRLQGHLAEREQRFADAETHYQTALKAYGAARDESAQAIVYNDLATIARRRRDFPRSLTYYRRALSIHEHYGEEHNTCLVLSNLGHLLLAMENRAAARDHYERGLRIARKIGREEIIGTCSAGIAQVLELELAHTEALPYAEAALAIHERLGYHGLERTRALVARLRTNRPT